MIEPQHQRNALFDLLREINLDSVFLLPERERFLFERLNEFSRAYARHMGGVSSAVLPATVSLGDILAEHARNPHRVRMFLEALAFQCTGEMLAMVWLTLLGSRIERLSYEYVREGRSVLAVTLTLPDRETVREFESEEHWDAAVLRFAALSKANELPVIEAFHPLWIPPQRTWDHDLYVQTAQGNFGAVDVAPAESPTPTWEVHQLYPKMPSRIIGSVELGTDGSPAFFPPREEEAPVLMRAWQALASKYGLDRLSLRPNR